MQVLLANPRCVCAGVDRAVRIVELALKQYGPPVYVRKEIVHNRHVVEQLRQQGAVFVEQLSEVPADALCIFSAHGVAPAVYEEAKSRGLQVIDATCPLVHKVHAEVSRFVSAGYHVILIGRQGHDEAVGTLGQAPGRVTLIEDEEQARNAYIPSGVKLAVITQTTLSVDDTQKVMAALRERFGEIQLPGSEDICYATQNRQNAVKALCDRGIDLLLVVGSKNSSNAARLVEVGQVRGVKSHLIDGPGEMAADWFSKAVKVGVTGGASTPDEIVQQVVGCLKEYGATSVEECSVAEEHTVFALPVELREAQGLSKR